VRVSMRFITILFFFLPLFFKTGAITYRWRFWPRIDMAFDTRRSVCTDDGSTILFPLPPDYDSNGNDINADEFFGLSPSVSKISLKVSDVKVKGCEFGAYLESDFTGVIDSTGTSTNTIGLLKMRYAFITAKWAKTKLIIGNALHPIYPEHCSPNTVNFNGGMPMASYARYPLIGGYRMWDKLTLGATLYSEFLFQSLGPIGFSRTYIRRGLMPGICLTAEWTPQDFIFGALFNWWRIEPANYTSPASDATKKYVTEAKVTSMIGSVWAGFKIGDLRINNQVLYGQNGPAFDSLGGYAVSCLNETTGACTYTNIKFASGWSDWEYTKHATLTPGFFIGLSKSLGSGSKPVYLDPTTHKPTFYGFDDDLDQVFRFAPRITTKFYDIFVGFEVDWSKAWFGAMDCCGKHPQTTAVSAIRFLLQTHAEF